MTEVDLIFNPYLLILLICIIYISVYAKDGLTNPLAIFFIFIAFYIPLKYYLIVLTGIEFGSAASEKFGKEYQTASISEGGYLILIFLLLSAIFQLIFKTLLKTPKIIGIYITVPVAIPTIILSVIIYLLFVLYNPDVSILDGLAFRNFSQLQGMAYITIALDTLCLICIYQYFQRGELKKLLFIMLYFVIYYFLNGRSGPIVMTYLFIFTYLFSVRRIVPIKLIVFSGIALVIFALIHGVIRTRGDITNFSLNIMAESNDAVFFLTALVERITQLEEFSMLSKLISDDYIETDFLSPLNIFIQFIPREFWDTKPLFFNGNIMSIMYPEQHNAGVNFAFLGLGEFIYSFGITLGLILAAIVMGYLLFLCENYLKFTKNNSEIFLFLYFIPYYFLFAGFNDGWMNTSVIPTIIINMMVFTIVGRFIKIR